MNETDATIQILHLAEPKPTRLKNTNKWKEVHYFIALGNPWPYNPELRMISETTRDAAKAVVFPSVAAALVVLKQCGEPPGWETEDAG